METSNGNLVTLYHSFWTGHKYMLTLKSIFLNTISLNKTKYKLATVAMRGMSKWNKIRENKSLLQIHLEGHGDWYEGAASVERKKTRLATCGDTGLA